MGNSQSLSCASGEKSSKAQQKEERYTKAPVEKVTENGNEVAEEKPANGDVQKEEGVTSDDVKAPEQTTDKKSGDEENQAEAEVKPEEAKSESVEVSEPAATEAAVEEAAPAAAEISTSESAEAPAAKAADVELKIEEPEDKAAEQSKDAAEENEKPLESAKSETTQAEETKDTPPAEEVESLSDAVLSALNSSGSGSGQTQDVDSKVVVNVNSSEVAAGTTSGFAQSQTVDTSAAMSTDLPNSQSDGVELADASASLSVLCSNNSHASANSPQVSAANLNVADVDCQRDEIVVSEPMISTSVADQVHSELSSVASPSAVVDSDPVVNESCVFGNSSLEPSVESSSPAPKEVSALTSSDEPADVSTTLENNVEDASVITEEVAVEQRSSEVIESLDESLVVVDEGPIEPTSDITVESCPEILSQENTLADSSATVEKTPSEISSTAVEESIECAIADPNECVPPESGDVAATEPSSEITEESPASIIPSVPEVTDTSAVVDEVSQEISSFNAMEELCAVVSEPCTEEQFSSEQQLSPEEVDSAKTPESVGINDLSTHEGELECSNDIVSECSKVIASELKVEGSISSTEDSSVEPSLEVVEEGSVAIASAAPGVDQVSTAEEIVVESSSNVGSLASEPDVENVSADEEVDLEPSSGVVVDIPIALAPELNIEGDSTTEEGAIELRSEGGEEGSIALASESSVKEVSSDEAAVESSNTVEEIATTIASEPDVENVSEEVVAVPSSEIIAEVSTDIASESHIECVEEDVCGELLTEESVESPSVQSSESSPVEPVSEAVDSLVGPVESSEVPQVAAESVLVDSACDSNAMQTTESDALLADNSTLVEDASTENSHEVEKEQAEDKTETQGEPKPEQESTEASQSDQ